MPQPRGQRQRRVGHYAIDQPTISAPGAQPKQRRHTHHAAPPQLAQIQEQPFYDDTNQSLTSASSPFSESSKNSRPAAEARQRRHTHYTMMDTSSAHVSQPPNLGAINEEDSGMTSAGGTTLGGRIVPSKTPRMRAFSTPDSVTRDLAVKQYYHDKMLELRRARREVNHLPPLAVVARTRTPNRMTSF